MSPRGSPVSPRRSPPPPPSRGPPAWCKGSPPPPITSPLGGGSPAPCHKMGSLLTSSGGSLTSAGGGSPSPQRPPLLMGSPLRHAGGVPLTPAPSRPPPGVPLTSPGRSPTLSRGWGVSPPPQLVLKAWNGGRHAWAARHPPIRHGWGGGAGGWALGTHRVKAGPRRAAPWRPRAPTPPPRSHWPPGPGPLARSRAAAPPLKAPRPGAGPPGGGEGGG